MRLFCDVMTYVFFNLLSEYRDTSFSLHAPSHQQANRPHKPVLTDRHPLTFIQDNLCENSFVFDVWFDIDCIDVVLNELTASSTPHPSAHSLPLS